jgi:K+-sensing histidine kinase KdpD
MKNSVKRFSVVIGFLALLMVLAINAGVMRHQVDTQIEAHDWVLHTPQRDVGPGLGLWVSKQIVERHGGSIHADTRGRELPGARFTVLLPASETEKSEAALAD